MSSTVSTIYIQVFKSLSFGKKFKMYSQKNSQEKKQK